MNFQQKPISLPDFMNKLYIFTFLVFFAFGSYFLGAQSILNKVELKKEFDSGVNGYPYDVGGGYSPLAYAMHDPAIRLSEGEFAHIWNPSKGNFSKRTIVKYNILLEEMWRKEFELDHEEDIVHAFSNDTAIMVLTTKYYYLNNSYRLLLRTANIDSGYMSDSKVIHQCFGKSNQELMLSLSPDRQSILVYYFEPSKKTSRLRVYRDYLYTDESLGYKINGAKKVLFKRYDLHMNQLNEGEIILDLLPKHKSMVFACQLDDKGNVYTSIFDKPSFMRVIMYDVKTQTQKSLSFDGFLDYWTEDDPYITHIPPVIGNHGKVYLAMADRMKLRRFWQTQSYEIVAFDFNAGVIDQTRKVETNSTLLVEVSKARQEFGMRPLKAFDKYLIKEIIEMPDESLWLVIQKYEYDYRNNNYFAPSPLFATNYKIEELIFFEFDPLGEFKRSFIVPSFQRPEGVDDFESLFYNIKIDKKAQEIHMLSHEMRGEKLTEPPRTFYRKIDLREGTYTPRVQVYEGRRRINNFFKYYTVWLNSSVATMMVEDGHDGRTYLLSVDLLGEPEEEEDLR